jgi:hypothetical protein
MALPTSPALRAWTGANLLLSTLLVLAWWLGGATRSRSVAATRTAQDLPAGSVQFAAPTGLRQVLAITCTVPLSASEEPTAPMPATLLRLHPAVPGRLRRIGQRRLEFQPDGPWPAATAIEAILDPTFVLPDGRRLGPATARFIARPLTLAEVVIRDGANGPQAAGQELGLSFSLPVARDDLLRALAIEPAQWAMDGLEPLAGAAPAGSAWSLHLKPLAAPPPALVVLRLRGDLQPAGGGQPLGEALRREVPLVEDAALGGLDAHSDGIVLRSTHELALPGADDLVTIPPRPLQWERTWGGLMARCTLNPGELVRVRAAPGFPGRGRFRITAPIDDVLRIADARPALDFPQRGTVLSSAAQPVLELASTNVARARLRLRRVYDNNAVRFAQRTWSVPDAACTPWRSGERVLDGPRNQRQLATLDLRQLWGGTLPTGWYEVEAQPLDGDSAGSGPRKLVQISDLACTVRHAGGDVAVRVWSLAGGGPVADAQVEVLSPTNQRLCGGDTAVDGTAVLHHAIDAEDATPYLVVVRHGDDALAMDLERFPLVLVDAQFAGAADPEGRLDGWLWAERGLVRPGEELRVAGLVRDASGRAPLGQALELRVLSPDRKPVATIALGCPADGLVELRHPLPRDAWFGGWRVELWTADAHPLRLAETLVRVETFIPDRIAAEAAITGARAGIVVAAGADLGLTVATRWRTGEPAADCRVEARVRVESADLVGVGEAAGHSFALTAGSEAWNSMLGGMVDERLAASGSDGTATLRLALPKRRPQVLRVRVETASSEPGGRPVYADAAALVLSATEVLGVRGILRDGQVVAEARFAGPDGAVAAHAGPVRLRLERRRWRWDLRERNGRLAWDTLIEREELASAVGEAGAEIAWPAPAPSADTWLVVTATDGATVLAEQVVGSPPMAPDRLRVTVAGAVAPGGTARLVCSSPLAGDALVTLEGSGIIASAVHHLDAGETVIELPMPATVTRPTLHAVIVLATPQRGHGEGRLWLAGGAAIAVQRPGWAGAVTVDAADASDPDGSLPVAVHAPGARHVLVAAVDEAVLARTHHPVPDPLAWFNRPRAAAGRGATSLADLLERPRWPLEPGGDGDDEEADPFAARLAARADDLGHLGAFACWQMVELDDAGEGGVRLPLAGFEGSARVVAVAAGDAICAAASRSVLVRAPLGLRVALPRVVAPGDRLRAMVTVTARGAAGTVTLAVDGGGRFAVEPPAPMAVAADQPLTMELPVTASTAGGDAALILTATLALADGGSRQRRISVALPVRQASRFVEEQQVILVGPDTAWTAPGTWKEPPTVGLTIPRDRRDELRPALEQLISYPYGCGEQLATQVQVLAACAGLAEHLDGSGVERARNLLPHGISGLRALEQGDGFPYWQGGQADPALTVHVVAALLAADAAGVTASAKDRERWLDLVDAVVRSDKRLPLRCQGVAALAAGHRPVSAWIDALAERSTAIEERSWLALAAAGGGDQARALALLANADPSAAPTVRETDGLLRSPLRAAAIELRARLACDPGDGRVALLAARLAAAVRAPRGLTTQELAHVLPALDAWQAVQADLPPAALAIDRIAQAPAPGVRQVVDGPLLMHSSRPQAVLVDFSGWRIDPAMVGADGIHVQRRFRRWRDGVPATHLVRGEIYAAELLVDSPRPVPGGVLTDLLGGGWEAEPRPPGSAPGPLAGEHDADLVHGEAHDDRVFLVHAGLPQGRSRLVHAVRAITDGFFTAGAPALEAFYDPTIQAVGGAELVEVVEP